MLTDDSRAARRRAALALFAPPPAPTMTPVALQVVEAPVVKPVPTRGLYSKGMLQYESEGKEAHLIFTFKDESNPKGYISVNSKIKLSADDELLATLALKAMEVILPMEFRLLDLHVEDDALRGKLLDVQEIIPNIRLHEKADHEVDNYNALAKLKLRPWKNKRIGKKGITPQQAQQSPRVSPYSGKPRSLHIEGYGGNGKGFIGVGCVTKEFVADPETGTESWYLRFYSGTGEKPAPTETLASMIAVNSYLATSPFKDKASHQTVIIHVSDETAATIFSTGKDNKKLVSSLPPAESEQFHRFKKLATGVQVSVVYTGHYGDDPLSLAANRLGTAERRNAEMEMPMELRRNMRERIINDALEDVRNKGVTATLFSEA